MSGNTFGQIFRLTTFGESHGVALGGCVDGCPAGLALESEYIQKRLDERRPGGNSGSADALASTSRKESDRVEILSGIFEGKTTGTPIGFVIKNEDQRSRDYGHVAQAFRPGHGDISYMAKYGFRDYRGGGRSSARETVSRVVGGAIAECLLASVGIEIYAAAVEMGGIAAPDFSAEEFTLAHTRPFFAASPDAVALWQERVVKVRGAGDSLGGIVRIEARQVPAGLGEPVFQKLDAMLAAALMSVGAVKGVEVGAGFAAARMLGSENNDGINPQGFVSNNAGGILGGISSGQHIILHAAIKPIPTLGRVQNSIDSKGAAIELNVGGRHDICAIPRVVPVLRSMVALTLADALLLQRRMGQREYSLPFFG